MDNLKSLSLLWVGLAKNHRYQQYVQKADIKTFLARVENEGIRFLTMTLPTIGKALDEFHSKNEWKSPSMFKTRSALCWTRFSDEGSIIKTYTCPITNFRSNEDSIRVPKPGPNITRFLQTGDVGVRIFHIPVFLQVAVHQALQGDSLAVDCVRQLTYIFYKLEMQHEEEVVSQFLGQFKRVDRELALHMDPVTLSESTENHIRSMRRIIGRVLCNTNPLDIRPNHGSGATACRTKNKDKWHVLRYYPKLDAVYPYSDLFFYNTTHLADELEKLENSKCCSPQARVVLVPKDSRGPRIISCEPAELMFAQQGLMRLLYDHLESNTLTKGQVNFTDQTINRQLAYYASIDRKHATIDLSEASDRVSFELVKRIFPQNWFDCLEATRSESTLLPDLEVVELNKFAPMGSSCCFPVEALTFWASAQATLQRIGVERPVFVYGDDIIVGSTFAEPIIKDLESIGLKINRHKSYTQGPFRESCGGDYHNGYDVTPVRVRKHLEPSCTSTAACSDLCNLLVAKFGYDSVVGLLDLIQEAVDYVYPRSELSIPLTIQLKPRACDSVLFKRRYRKRFQRWEHRILQPYTEVLTLRERTWCELLRKELAVSVRSSTADSTLFPSGKKKVEPGSYAVDQSDRLNWSWVWLG